jgi:uncharacterized protein YecT (DUF1311 family)
MRVAAAAVMLLFVTSAAFAQGKHPAADDSSALQDCIKTAAPADKSMSAAVTCIDTISAPCLKDAKSTADMNGCYDREKAVWDDILNETYRRLRKKLDDKQQSKLRDMQRAWIDSRDKTCDFYWDLYQGTMAADCVNRQTARGALFLLGFIYDQDK